MLYILTQREIRNLMQPLSKNVGRSWVEHVAGLHFARCVQTWCGWEQPVNQQQLLRWETSTVRLKWKHRLWCESWDLLAQVMEAEQARTHSEAEHKKTAANYNSCIGHMKQLESKLKRNINKSRSVCVCLCLCVYLHIVIFLHILLLFIMIIYLPLCVLHCISMLVGAHRYRNKFKRARERHTHIHTEREGSKPEIMSSNTVQMWSSGLCSTAVLGCTGLYWGVLAVSGPWNMAVHQAVRQCCFFQALLHRRYGSQGFSWLSLSCSLSRLMALLCLFSPCRPYFELKAMYYLQLEVRIP